MFGVLIVVLSPDGITDLGFSTRKCQILLIGSLRVLRSRWRFGRPGDGSGPDWRARIVRFEPFCMAHSLVVAGEALMRPMEDDKPQTLTHPRTNC